MSTDRVAAFEDLDAAKLEALRQIVAAERQLGRVGCASYAISQGHSSFDTDKLPRLAALTSLAAEELARLMTRDDREARELLSKVRYGSLKPEPPHVRGEN